MILNSRVISMSLALVISIITTSFLAFFKDLEKTVALVVFIVSFFSTYLLVFLVLEFLVFREIQRIYSVLGRLREKDYSFVDVDDTSVLNPLQRINKEITSYATNKQKEIDDLRSMEQFRKEFIANVSHELKTPIFAAQGFVHTLLDGAVKDRAVRKKFLKKAAKSLDGLDLLVQDLMVLSQIESGDIRMNYEYFDLRKLMDDIMDQFEEKAERKEIKLDWSYVGDEKEIMVFADWQRIRQVVNNLISNALNYTNEGGDVFIKVKKLDNDFIEISVRDNGIGIPKNDIDRIFERFYRVDKSRSRAKGGTGLGLAIVKHVLEGHNTTITVNSTPGIGTEFNFRLPVNEGHY